MARIQSRRHCKVCGQRTLHEHEHFSGGMGCLLTILTAGLFLPIWVLILIIEAFQPWRCQRCGSGRLT
jgi:uncharacterized protein (DUF983 family)